MSDIPTDAERAANRRAIMALTRQERFELLFGHPRTIMNDTPTTDKHIPNDFYQALHDVKTGKTVSMKTAMNDTPTPRTDEALCRDMLPAPRAIGWSHGRKVEWMGHNVVTADFARSLEKELTAAREELKKAEWTKFFAIEQAKELKAVTEQRDRLVENLERALNATVLNHRKDRWHIDAEYTLQLIQAQNIPHNER